MPHDAHIAAWEIYNLEVTLDMMNLLWWIGELK